MAWSKSGQEDADGNEPPMPRRVAKHMTTDVCRAECLNIFISRIEMRQAALLAVWPDGSFINPFHSIAKLASSFVS